MTAPAYHVGQILYHRASGERAIVVHAPIHPDETYYYLSAGCTNHVSEHESLIDTLYSAEPVDHDRKKRAEQVAFLKYIDNLTPEQRDKHILEALERINIKPTKDNP